MSATHVGNATYSAASEIESLVSGFESCTLPWPRWTHAAHLTVALWYLLRHDFDEAAGLVRDGIKRYNSANGVETTRERGYHETITLFWLRHVRSFLDESYNEGCSLVRLANRLVEGADKNLPLEYYSRELLFSWEARLSWAEPDLKPLP